ncbi:Uncharacterized protein PBTT_03495 [Plasmodiophora brassicae]
MGCARSMPVRESPSGTSQASALSDEENDQPTRSTPRARQSGSHTTDSTARSRWSATGKTSTRRSLGVGKSTTRSGSYKRGSAPGAQQGRDSSRTAEDNLRPNTSLMATSTAEDDCSRDTADDERSRALV